MFPPHWHHPAPLTPLLHCPPPSNAEQVLHGFLPYIQKVGGCREEPFELRNNCWLLASSCPPKNCCLQHGRTQGGSHLAKGNVLCARGGAKQGKYCEYPAVPNLQGRANATLHTLLLVPSDCLLAVVMHCSSWARPDVEQLKRVQLWAAARKGLSEQGGDPPPPFPLISCLFQRGTDAISAVRTTV